MEIYLVGGAVRDMVMGIVPDDEDFVVVGSTPDEMISRGFTQVGADFPVFLEPCTGNEYALARTERKVGIGHSGFTTKFDSTITLEDDLVRRDFTMNALVMDVDAGIPSEIIDHFGGLEDIARGIIRHVSVAFSEDPLRVLRAARFAAKYKFVIAPETLTLMTMMASRGELNTLKPQRVWKETAKAMMSDFPQDYFRLLKSVGALDCILGKASIAFECIDQRLMLAAERNASESARWMSVFFDVGQDIIDIFFKTHLIPKRLAKAIQFAKDANIADVTDIDSMIALIERHQLWHSHAVLIDYIEMREAVNVVDSSMYRLLTAIKYGNAVRFGDFPQEDQARLHGADIGKAIAAKRRVFIEEWVQSNEPA